MAQAQPMPTRRRRSRKKQLQRKIRIGIRIVTPFVFIGLAALLSAGVVRIVERPVAPWKKLEQSPPPRPAPDADRPPLPYEPVPLPD